MSSSQGRIDEHQHQLVVDKVAEEVVLNKVYIAFQCYVGDEIPCGAFSSVEIAKEVLATSLPECFEGAGQWVFNEDAWTFRTSLDSDCPDFAIRAYELDKYNPPDL